jgi:pimeloyl-ACP methyl ester carboxylesterase
MALSDGRTLAYAEYGDPNGRPVFFFHGMPGSRLFRPPDEITEKMGVRLITTDRPGYGLSTYQPGRCFLDWPGDITQLADHLNIEKFSVMGHSAGGPYVAACAYALPERVTSASALSAAGPLYSPNAMQGMASMNRLGLMIGRFTPWLFWRVLVWVFYHRRARDPAADYKHWNGLRPPADDEQLRNPAILEACITSELEAFRPGLLGLAWEARLLSRPWDIPLEEIRLPYCLWHGTEDDQTTLAFAQYVASKIPESRIILCKDEAHLLLFPHWEEILEQVIKG